MTENIWADKLKEAYEDYSIGVKGVTQWKIINLLILKYGFPLKARGLSAFELALRIINNKELFNKLSKEDESFILGLCK